MLHPNEILLIYANGMWTEEGARLFNEAKGKGYIEAFGTQLERQRRFYNL